MTPREAVAVEGAWRHHAALRGAGCPAVERNMTVEATLADLLPTALERFDAFGLLWRRERTASQPGWAVQEALRPFLLGAELTREWPGTRAHAPQLFCTYRLCPRSVAVLREASDVLALFGPGGPEDLSFYRDGVPGFISISHEQEAWFAD